MEKSRRNFIKKSALGATGLALGAHGIKAAETGNVLKTGDPFRGVAGPDKKLFWGDLHNHNAIGYAKGSLDRSFKIASGHLDFYCLTPHTQWPDMPVMPQNAHQKWEKGFKVAKDNWERVVQAVKEYHQPGRFVTFLGYEWHSNYCGDLCIIFPNGREELLYFDDVKKFQQYAKDKNALLIPHHSAYKQGWRGQDWDVLDTEVSPVAEIYSEHGNAESDRSFIRYIRHSMGGRSTRNTLHALWERGVRVGVIGSTDDHLGFPGAYGEGLAAVYADELSRESILEAVKARRTYGVSKDRIELDFRLNGHYMGESVPQTDRRSMKVKVKGKDVVDRVEILKNNRVIYRNHPVDKLPGSDRWQKPVFCRVEFGWGPWGDLSMERICDWKFAIEITGGKILSATPCFQSGPYDETRYNELSSSENSCGVTSYTSRKQAFAEQATNSIILEIQGTPGTELLLNLEKPQKLIAKKAFKDLEKSNEIVFTGPFTSESLMVHRLVFHENYYAEFDFEDRDPGKSTDWYYARVTQANGSLAWSSPVWVGE
jgi:hypothetical protein